MEVTKDTPTNDVKEMAPYVKPISAIPTVLSSETMNEEGEGRAKQQFLAKKNSKTPSKTCEKATRRWEFGPRKVIQ